MMSVYLTMTPVLSHSQDLLNPLIVTATRTEEEEVPYTVEKISKELLRQQARRTLPEALQFTPGVLVQKTTHGHGSPFIRGFTGRQNLLLVDGVRMNNSIWRSGPVQYWNTVDALALDSLELVKSQGSVIYGSDAIGGTLNAMTKSSQFMAQEQGLLFAHGSAFYEYRSNGEGSHTGRLENSIGVGGKYGLHVGLTQRDFGDIRDSAVGRMRGTGYDESSFDLRFDALLSPGMTLTVASQYVDQNNISRWHRTLQNPGWKHDGHIAAAGSWVANDYDQERSLTYLRIEQDIAEQSSWLKKWTATLSYQTTADSEKQDRRTAPNAPYTSARYLQFQNAYVDTYGLDVTLESDVGLGELVYGLDYYHDDVESDTLRNSGAGLVNRPGARPIADDAHYDMLGVFANYQWSPADRWQLSAGTRFTYASAEWGAYRPPSAIADIAGDSSWTNFSSSLRASYKLQENWLAYISAAQSFRAPNLADLTGNSASMAGLDSHGSPDLEPEKFLTLEMGTRGQLGENVQLQAAVFHTFSTGGAISSYTTPAPSNNTFVVNGDDSSLYGVEAEMIWELDENWTARGFVAWQEGKNDISQRTPDTERWIPRMLPFTGSAALRYTAAENLWWVEARLTGAVTADRVHPQDQTNDNQRIPTNGTPSYLVPALYAGYRISENFDLNLGLENLTNEDYRIHGSGQNETGFNAIVGLRATW
jgi:hemoglobin/transferrin/lactoferrin receptor protein